MGTLRAKVNGAWVDVVSAVPEAPEEVAVQADDPGAGIDLWYDTDGVPPAASGGLIPPGGLPGQVLIKNSASDFDASWVDASTASGLLLKTGPVGSWLPAWTFDSAVAQLPSMPGELKMVRSYWGSPVDALSVDVAVAAPTSNPATIMAGVYEQNADGTPGALITGSVGVDVTSIGNKVIPFDAVVPPGLYYVAILGGGLNTAEYRGSPSSMHDFMYMTGAQSGPQLHNSLFRLNAGATLPDPAGPVESRNGMINCFLRVAA